MRSVGAQPRLALGFEHGMQHPGLEKPGAFLFDDAILEAALGVERRLRDEAGLHLPAAGSDRQPAQRLVAGELLVARCEELLENGRGSGGSGLLLRGRDCRGCDDCQEPYNAVAHVIPRYRPLVQTGYTAAGRSRASPGVTGTCRSGIGVVTNSFLAIRARMRARFADRATRALSVAMPVFAYICR